MNKIAVKGKQNNLIVTLPVEGTTNQLIADLGRYLKRTGTFFRNGRVTLDVGHRKLERKELNLLRGLFNQWSVQCDALSTSNNITRAAALALGLQLPLLVEKESQPTTNLETELPDESHDALLVRRTLRSGQIVRYPAAVVVLGDVNPGAEIIAGSDIIVLGALRGLVHAGATGNDDAVVCALTLSATQLRIGNHIAMAPETKQKTRYRFLRRSSPVPECARVQNENIVVERWFNGELLVK